MILPGIHLKGYILFYNPISINPLQKLHNIERLISPLITSIPVFLLDLFCFFKILYSPEAQKNPPLKKMRYRNGSVRRVQIVGSKLA